MNVVKQGFRFKNDQPNDERREHNGKGSGFGVDNITAGEAGALSQGQGARMSTKMLEFSLRCVPFLETWNVLVTILFQMSRIRGVLFMPASLQTGLQLPQVANVHPRVHSLAVLPQIFSSGDMK